MITTMKIKVHKETLYVLSLVLAAFAIAMSVVANLGTSVYTVPALALAGKIRGALPPTWNSGIVSIIGSQPFSELIIQTMFLIIFCIIIRKFRPFFLLSFVTTFLYAAMLYGFQWIPAFWPDVVHNYPLAVRIVLLLSAIITLSISVACSLKAYLYPPTVTFAQKGVIQHFNIKHEGLFFLAYDFTFMVISIFLIYAMYQDWKFWEHNLSYGSLATVLISGPLIGLFSKLFDKVLETKTLFPKWEKAFEIENKKGY